MAESSSPLRDVLARCRTLLAETEQGSVGPGDTEHDHAREAQLLVSGVLRLAPGVLAQRSARGDRLSAGELAQAAQALHRRLRGERRA
ncbi:MAG: hypothetical protein IBJ19_15130 [Gemmatimonadaceae bacterium]|nr:hypothetical protein [Gemmatimonadaceae bacterium]